MVKTNNFLALISSVKNPRIFTETLRVTTILWLIHGCVGGFIFVPGQYYNLLLLLMTKTLSGV
jgi:hypothetical protein